MNDDKRQKHKDYIIGYATKFKDKTQLKQAELEKLFNSLIELHEIPFPPTELRKFFLHPNIIKDLLLEVFNSDSLTRDDRFGMKESFKELNKLIQWKRSAFSINFRILAPGGNYPNIELERASSKYTFNNQFPVLITKNRNKKDIWADTSILNWLTRMELKFATAVMCAPEKGLFHFQFTSYNSLNIDNDCFEYIPNELRVYFLRELLDLQRRFTPIGVRSWNRKPLPDVKEYEFSDYQKSADAFKQIYDKFSIQDDLLLRTCNYFVKAIMHWDNHINAEEAITNNFMCLEGCLHLIQKKYGDNKTQLNRKLLYSVFQKDITNGENLYDFIIEGYGKRNALVHPEPHSGAQWDTSIISEDFYEYFNISRMLLNFILIDRLLDDY